MSAKDNAVTADEAVGASGSIGLFDRLPEWVVDTLSAEQKKAIHQAIGDSLWTASPVNIRFTVPFFGKKYYVTIVGGGERRGPERQIKDRNKYPLRTVANVFFFIGLVTLFYLLALFVLALQSAIIEF
ncbi:MAG: hypothetical protein V3R37_07005 [Rhodospirillales bacterium]